MQVEVLDDDAAVARRAAAFIAAEARAAVQLRGRFTFAVSGGRTPWLMLSVLAAEDMPWADTHLFLSTLKSLLTVHPLTHEIHETGLDLAERYSLSIYDSMIAASALHAACDTLWSEDMQHGMALDDRLRIVDPFRQPPWR